MKKRNTKLQELLDIFYKLKGGANTTRTITYPDQLFPSASSLASWLAGCVVSHVSNTITFPPSNKNRIAYSSQQIILLLFVIDIIIKANLVKIVLTAGYI